MAAKKKEIPVSKIVEMRSLQAREKMDMDAVGEYALAMASGQSLPPVHVVEREDGSFLLVDGWHRVAAARQAGEKRVEALIESGDENHAMWLAAAANKSHGLRRTHEDKRRAVLLAWKAAPDAERQEIADHCGVSYNLAAQHEEGGKRVAEVEKKSKKARKDAEEEGEDEVGAAMAAARSAIEECVGDIELAQQSVKGLLESDHAAFVHGQSVNADLKNALTALKQAIPKARCPVCNGSKCATCRKTGWVSEQQFALIPKSQKKW